MKLNFTLNESLAFKGKGTHLPLVLSVPLGSENPVSIFLKVAQKKEHAFLLESVEGEKKVARYSFIGIDPYKIFDFYKQQGRVVFRSGVAKRVNVLNPLVYIQKAVEKIHIPRGIAKPEFMGGAVGYLGYEGVRYFENIPEAAEDPLKIPDGMYGFFDTVIVVDHVRRGIKIVQLLELKGDITKKYGEAAQVIDRIARQIREGTAEPILDFQRVNQRKISADLNKRFISNTSKSAYKKGVQKAKEYIANGDAIQVVYSQRFQVPFRQNGFLAYQALRHINPSPYMYYLKFPKFEIAGSSPEVFARCEKGEIFLTVLAGTRKRGENSAEDTRLIANLLADEKENAEHVMLVDLGRNDVGKVGTIGSVRVSKYKYIVKYSHVLHIASDVTGTMKNEMNAFDLFCACFPRGTVSGAPKIRAMEIIAGLEKEKRGVYAGGIGYFDFEGNMNAALGIRTIVIKDRKAYVQSGAGIVYDSDPEREYEESVNKAKGPLKALLIAKQAGKNASRV